MLSTLYSPSGLILRRGAALQVRCASGITSSVPSSLSGVVKNEQQEGVARQHSVEDEGQVRQKQIQRMKDMEKEMMKLKESLDKSQRKTGQLRRALMECEDRRENDARLHAEQQQRAGARLARDMLSVKDMLERTRVHPSSDALSLVIRDMLARLRSHGVEPLPAERQRVGAQFDPTIHNAISATPIPRETVAAIGTAAADGGPVVTGKTRKETAVKSGTIAHIFKDGFTINGILLRPADVSVYM